MQRILLFSLAVFSLALSACGSFQTVKDSWKFTTRQYRTYLNTPAELDLDDKGNCELYELALSDAVIDVDEELQKLIRAMENSDHNPDQMWVMSIMRRVPWLSGVALIDKGGTLVAQYPEYFSKPFDASPLVEPDPKQRMGALRAYVQMTEAGPEVYVGNPVYGGEELRGIIVAYFDPRALVTMSSNPGSFMIASPAGIIWPGRYGAGSVIGSTDWSNLLQRQSCGVIGSKGSEFFWTTRYVGNLPLVYAMPTSAGQEALLPDDSPRDSARSGSSAASRKPAVSSGDEAGAPPAAEQPESMSGASESLQPASPAEPQTAVPSEQTREDGQMTWPAQAPDFQTPLEAPKPEQQAAPSAGDGAQQPGTDTGESSRSVEPAEAVSPE